MHRKQTVRVLMLAVLTFAAAYPAAAQAHTDVYPGKTWQQADVEKLGWSKTALADAQQYYLTMPPSSVVIVDHGLVVAEWGDPAMRVKISSGRKSMINALYGIYVKKGRINLNKTMAQLGIDDVPPLNAEEKQATVKMLLESRSGVYHPAIAATPGMRAGTPKRGSHEIGTFWYYNNWDFNVLGTIFEQQTHTKIGTAFQDNIAKPLKMEDFRAEDVYYLRKSPDDPEGDSIHPAYHFRMTARDMARFGYLYLRQGKWEGKQVVPSEWVTESTTAYSETPEGGYGYLWWVDGFDLPVKSFSARGALAKYIVVIPERDLVVVYQNHTEYPDKSLTEKELNKLPTIPYSQMGVFLKMILDAQRGQPQMVNKQ